MKMFKTTIEVWSDIPDEGKDAERTLNESCAPIFVEVLESDKEFDTDKDAIANSIAHQGGFKGFGDSK